METDRHYFIEGLFIIGSSIAAVLFILWLVTSGHRDDVLYRIYFAESVSGLSLGDSVKYHGVEVGTVKAMGLDTADPRRVQVDVKLRRETPVKTDTRATLTMKGITGVNFIELNGGAPEAKGLVAVTKEGQIPEIRSEKSTLAVIIEKLPKIIERLPKIIEKFSAIEDKVQKVVTDVEGVTAKIKEDPSLLLRRPKVAPAADK